MRSTGQVGGWQRKLGRGMTQGFKSGNDTGLGNFRILVIASEAKQSLGILNLSLRILNLSLRILNLSLGILEFILGILEFCSLLG